MSWERNERNQLGTEWNSASVRRNRQYKHSETRMSLACSRSRRKKASVARAEKLRVIFDEKIGRGPVAMGDVWA